ncbi:lipopolysaccharide export system permease protein [Lebetimonas natsushimae]|uniref:Lipopolysaccharide export system permease protein n=1 Tax=Lebetimonas natsushimae TaxID=1936991 RepID=A0A292YDQ0_9BACT|nr:LptF/LptG family permease [Lebetimonas natsushimae]GAX87499.1 lipopolysaccharide export system permease protein [Lebetimonas natsushimae]
MYFVYLLKKYIKNFFIFLFSLSFLYLLIDIIANFSKLPNSSNLQILYSVYVLGYSFENFYPLALIFSFLYSIYYLIKYNYMVSFYSLGFSKRKILFPFLFLAFIVYLLFLVLDNTNYVYLNQKAKNIISSKKIKKENLFLKHKNNIVYIKELKPLLKKAIGLKIFVLNNMELKKIINIKEAIYQNNVWNGTDVTIITINNDKMNVKKLHNLSVLKNFEPLVLSNLKRLDSLSIKDALLAIKIFKDIKLNKIIAVLLYKILTPLSIILLLIYFMYISPIHQRISNISVFMIKSIFFVIFIWGINLLIYKFVKQGVLSPFVLFLPLLFIVILDFYVIKKENL